MDAGSDCVGRQNTAASDLWLKQSSADPSEEVGRAVLATDTKEEQECWLLSL
jgi:hypothetical protein